MSETLQYEEHPNKSTVIPCSIDIFFHDSLHTFEHMYFEYKTAWPHLSEAGILLSDDIYWSSAFHRFASEVGRPYLRVGRLGAVRK